jgi:hypothetical protein
MKDMIPLTRCLLPGGISFILAKNKPLIAERQKIGLRVEAVPFKQVKADKILSSEHIHVLHRLGNPRNILSDNERTCA